MCMCVCVDLYACVFNSRFCRFSLDGKRMETLANTGGNPKQRNQRTQFTRAAFVLRTGFVRVPCRASAGPALPPSW